MQCLETAHHRFGCPCPVNRIFESANPTLLQKIIYILIVEQVSLLVPLQQEPVVHLLTVGDRKLLDKSRSNLATIQLLGASGVRLGLANSLG